MANTFLGYAPASNDKSVQSEYSFPADCYVVKFNFSTDSRQVVDQTRMLIWYGAAPAALFNNAPNGSVCFDTATGDVYIKTAAATWTKASP